MSAEIGTAVGGGLDFVSAEAAEAALEAEDVGTPEVREAVVDSYEDAQLQALKGGVFVALALSVAAALAASRLPASMDDVGLVDAGRGQHDLAAAGWVVGDYAPATGIRRRGVRAGAGAEPSTRP